MCVVDFFLFRPQHVRPLPFKKGSGRAQSHNQLFCHRKAAVKNCQQNGTPCAGRTGFSGRGARFYGCPEGAGQGGKNPARRRLREKARRMGIPPLRSESPAGPAPLCAGLPTPHHQRPKVSRFEECLETFGRPFRRGRETRAERALRMSRISPDYSRRPEQDRVSRCRNSATGV
jgi:hypothetical protein